MAGIIRALGDGVEGFQVAEPVVTLFPGVARTLGAASVTGTARRSSLAAARASALPYDEVIASEDLLATLGGQRFDVVIDPVGGQVRTDSLKVMAPLGRMLLVGNASGDWQHTVATNSLSLAIAGFPPATTSRRIPGKPGPPPRARSTPSRKGCWISGPRSSRWPKPPRRTAAPRTARSAAGSC